MAQALAATEQHKAVVLDQTLEQVKQEDVKTNSLKEAPEVSGFATGSDQLQLAQELSSD